MSDRILYPKKLERQEYGTTLSTLMALQKHTLAKITLERLTDGAFLVSGTTAILAERGLDTRQHPKSTCRLPLLRSTNSELSQQQEMVQLPARRFQREVIHRRWEAPLLNSLDSFL